jgi:hypothetical protein
MAANEPQVAGASSSPLEHLLRQWTSVIRDLNTSLGLPSRVMEKYFNELSQLRQPATNRFLLMANFEMYANCVSDVLLYLKSINPANGETIGVTTVFRQPLHYWYNLTRRQRVDENAADFTTTPWEEYKRAVKALKTPRVHPEHALHMRRIVEKRLIEEAGRQFVYCDGADSVALDPGDAHTRLRDKPDCLTVMAEVIETIEHSIGDAVYLIANHDSALCNEEHGSWYQLLWNFQIEYHNRVCDETTYIDGSEKGVFCCYAPIKTTAFTFEDMFLIDMREIGGNTFGVSFHRDEYDRPGIAFLTDLTVRNLLGETDALWKAAGGRG